MSLLFETIKIENGKVMHLHYHQERMDKSLKKAIILDKVIEDYFSGKELPNNGIHKLRITYSIHSGVKNIELIPYEKREIKTLKLISSSTIYYGEKLLKRAALDELKTLKGECDDILIVKDGHITDTSFSNIVFFCGESWITPNTPLLPGTCRARLLKEGIITERCITPAEVEKLSGFILINAMNDFSPQDMKPISGIIL